MPASGSDQTGSETARTLQGLQSVRSGYVASVLTLFFVLMLAVAFISLVASMRRRSRHMLEQQERLEREMRSSGGEVDPYGGASPFEMLPFGGLLESLMSGMGARSFRWDEETGEWVEMTDEAPQPEALPDHPEPETADADLPARRRKRSVHTAARRAVDGAVRWGCWAA